MLAYTVLLCGVGNSHNNSERARNQGGHATDTVDSVRLLPTLVRTEGLAADSWIARVQSSGLLFHTAQQLRSSGITKVGSSGRRTYWRRGIWRGLSGFMFQVCITNGAYS